MKNSANKKQINNSNDILEEKSKNIEIYEDFEQDDKNEDLIGKKRKSKKNGKNSITNKLLIIISINISIILIIYILYLFYEKDIIINNNKIEIENNMKSQSKLPEINLKSVNIINNTDYYSLRKDKIVKFPIESVSQFPSGSVISVDWITINIYDINYNLIQKIPVFDAIQETYYRKEQKKMYKVEIKDENNFAIYSNDGSLKIYNKQGNEFILKQSIENEGVVELLYDSEGKIITGCRDNTIKIFEQNNNGEYKKIKTRDFADAFHIKILKDKNILISKDIDFIQFYNIKENYKLIETIRQKSIHEFELLGDDQIIVYTNNTLKIISIKDYKEIKTIQIDFQAYAIKLFKEKGLILVGGCKKLERGMEKGIFSIYKSDNFELIKSIEDFHGTCVKGISVLKNGLIATFGNDPDNGYPIKIWTLE